MFAFLCFCRAVMIYDRSPKATYTHSFPKKSVSALRQRLPYVGVLFYQFIFRKQMIDAPDPSSDTFENIKYKCSFTTCGTIHNTLSQLKTHLLRHHNGVKKDCIFLGCGYSTSNCFTLKVKQTLFIIVGRYRTVLVTIKILQSLFARRSGLHLIRYTVLRILIQDPVLFLPLDLESGSGKQFIWIPYRILDPNTYFVEFFLEKFRLNICIF